MPIFKPFKGYRPNVSEAKRFASLPFDSVSKLDFSSYSVSESQFLKVTRPDLYFDISQKDSFHSFSKDLLSDLIESGDYIQDETENFYLYGLTSDAKSYYSIFGCLCLEDYQNGNIKVHEKTRDANVEDRFHHILDTGFHTEPVFGAIRYNLDIDLIINDCLFLDPDYDFVTSDGITHQFWRINNISKIKRIQQVFENDINSVYIADGHHRSAASLAVHEFLKNESRSTDASSMFLAAIFPMHQLHTNAYHRLLSTDGVETNVILEKVSCFFYVSISEQPYYPNDDSYLGLYLGNKWYILKYRNVINHSDVASSFNNSVIVNIFNVLNIQTSDKIEYISKLKDVEFLFSSADHTSGKVLFTLPSITPNKIFDLSDKGIILPPKSSWFDPKPRSGLVIHSLEL